MLGVAVEVTGRAAGSRGTFASIYGAFRDNSSDEIADPLRFELEPLAGGAGCAVAISGRGSGQRLAWQAEPEQLCLHLASYVYAVSPWRLVHAAVLARDGRALLLCATSGTGKSTLALELARRGFELLSDELAPIPPGAGVVEPFPRAVGLRAGTLALLPWLAGAAGIRLPNAKGEFKLFVDPAAVPGLRVGGAATPRDIVFLALPRDPAVAAEEAGRTLEVTLGEGAEAAGEELARLPGVEAARRLADRDLPTWRLRVAREAAIGEALESWSRRAGAPFVASRWGAHLPPRFAGEPVVERLAASAGLLELQRHLLGRARAAGAGEPSSPARILLDLAAACRDARFWRVESGSLAATAERLAAL